MYPRVKVRVPEQKDFVYPQNDSGTWMILKYIESLNYKEEKNQSNCSQSISKDTKSCPQYRPIRSTPSTKGILKSSKRVGESPKQNARASSVMRPRAVLSSPDNDELVGIMNDLNNNVSSTQRKKDTRGKIESPAKDLCNNVKLGKTKVSKETIL
ncbi:uncharacterized protein LOC130720788 isoform X2 [Lotus japonicus]|uniref:uncharacterized protein LOC130720788 isoform X2 n=1 Tax=Lotus japonicus TaxID=34305 RepID=UPI00258AC401|nr:uncharacterized protein LOC130720788 isoform X2 [Lotus japonicus]